MAEKIVGVRTPSASVRITKSTTPEQTRAILAARKRESINIQKRRTGGRPSVYRTPSTRERITSQTTPERTREILSARKREAFVEERHRGARSKNKKSKTTSTKKVAVNPQTVVRQGVSKPVTTSSKKVNVQTVASPFDMGVSFFGHQPTKSKGKGKTQREKTFIQSQKSFLGEVRSSADSFFFGSPVRRKAKTKMAIRKLEDRIRKFGGL